MIDLRLLFLLKILWEF